MQFFANPTKITHPEDAKYFDPSSIIKPKNPEQEPDFSRNNFNLFHKSPFPNFNTQSDEPRRVRRSTTRNQGNITNSVFQRPVLRQEHEKMLKDFVNYLHHDCGLTVKKNNNKLKVSIKQGGISSGTLTLNGYMCDVFGISPNATGGQSFFMKRGQVVTITNTFETLISPSIVNQVVATSNIFGESIVGNQHELACVSP